MSKFVFAVNHVGTLIDAPTHIVRGKTLTEFAPQKFVGPAIVLNFVDHARGLLTRADIEPYLDRIQPGDMVLIHSGGDHYWKTPAYLKGWCYPDVEATRALIDRQISIIGFDGPSADSMDPLEMTQHQLLLEREILIVENLTNLQQLPERVLLVIGALPVQHANGAPARVFALF
jgi:kynurenine formamidase